MLTFSPVGSTSFVSLPFSGPESESSSWVEGEEMVDRTTENVTNEKALGWILHFFFLFSFTNLYELLSLMSRLMMIFRSLFFFLLSFPLPPFSPFRENLKAVGTALFSLHPHRPLSNRRAHHFLLPRESAASSASTMDES